MHLHAQGIFCERLRIGQHVCLPNDRARFLVEYDDRTACGATLVVRRSGSGLFPRGYGYDDSVLVDLRRTREHLSRMSFNHGFPEFYAGYRIDRIEYFVEVAEIGGIAAGRF